MENKKQRRQYLVKALALIIVCVFSGCATDIANRSVSESVMAQLVPGKILTSPIKSTASVGDVMLTAGEYSLEATQSKKIAIKIDEPIAVPVKHKRHTFEFRLPSGEYILAGKSEDGFFYVSPTPIMESHGRTGYGGIFAPIASPRSATEIFWVWSPKNPILGNFYSASLPSTLSINPTDYIKKINDGIQQGPLATLTYAGVAGGQIRFVYKEFTEDGYARAAFTQEVGLDYKPGELYAYKNARFTVEKADTTHIEFTLISGL